MDLNYDPEFDVIKNEIGKLGNIDFEMVEKSSLSMLTQKTKDIRLFSFLALCYLRRKEWQLFCDAIDAMGQWVGRDYNGLFPPRPRAKQLAFKWIAEDRFADAIETATPPADSFEHIKRLIAGLELIKTRLDAEFPNGSPFPSRLHSAALKWAKATEPKKQESPVVSGTPPQSVATASAQSATPVGSRPAETSAPIESPKDAYESIRKTALFLIEKEPQKPLGYRMIRAVRWGSVDSAPVAEGSATKLEPPSQERRTFIQSLLGKGDFKVTLESVEKAFSSGPTHYWLDLQRIAATAASQMGAPFAAVHQAILLETALFVRRIPQIKELTYTDGTPFCDPATRDWLDGEVATVFASGSAVPVKSAEDPIEADKREANALISANNIEAALDVLLKKICASNSERDGFRRRVVVASVLLSAKRADLAVYILEYLCDMVQANKLDSWDPDCASEALTLLAKAYSMLSSGKQGAALIKLAEKREEILKRLSYIDPLMAFKQKAGGKSQESD